VLRETIAAFEVGNSDRTGFVCRSALQQVAAQACEEVESSLGDPLPPAAMT